MADNDPARAEDLNQLLKRIAIAEDRLLKLESDDAKSAVDRVKSDLLSRKVYTSTFFKVADGYYDKTLAERAQILQCSIPQLCKSIIFENTAWAKESDAELSDPTNSRFYLVLVQYEG